VIGCGTFTLILTVAEHYAPDSVMSPSALLEVMMLVRNSAQSGALLAAA
jgi:hypothetical protein